MLNRRRRLAPVRLLTPLAGLALLVPLVLSACITVESDLVSPTPTRAPASPLASPAQAPLATPTPLPTPRPTPAPIDAQAIGFVPYWLFGDAADSIDPNLLSIAAFHSLEAAQNGSLVTRKPNGDIPAGWQMLSSERFEQVKGELQADGVKVVPVIQRTAWTEGTRQRMITLLSRRQSRRALVEAIAGFVQRRGFDGVNLDFEPLPETVAEQYVLLVRELRAALDELDPELHLSVDVVPGLENYDLAALTAEDAADLAVIMGYGYRSAASGQTGSVAPLVDASGSDLTSTVAAAVAQAAPERLALALPWYGTAWSTESPQPGAPVRGGRKVVQPSVALYRDALEQAASAGRDYDPEQGAAVASYATTGCPTCEPTWRQVWYEDPDGFGAKLELALGQGLDVGVWAVGMEGDHDELWWTLRNHLRPREDEAPPGGSTALDPDTVEGDIDGRPVVSGVANLRLFASDEPEGSGLGFVRIGLDGALDGEGMLVTARTYPAVDRIEFPLADPATGGSDAEGPRSIHVQWRDLAGNWSVPIVIEAHVLDPERTTTPADL